MIRIQFKNSYFGLKTLQEQITYLMKIIPELTNISLESYRKFLHEEKIVTYKSFTRVSATVNSEKNKETRLIVLRIMIEMISDDYLLLFFDESSVQNYSVKNKGWFLKGKRSVVDLKVNYHSIKILAMISFSGIEGLQFTSKSNSQIIFEFMSKALPEIISQNRSKRIAIFLDNAKMNHGKVIKQLCESLNIILIFNAVSSPHLNTIEHLFEFMKRDLRLLTNSNKYQILKGLIIRAKRFDKTNIQKIWEKQQNDFEKILCKKNLYTNMENSDESE